MSIVIAGSYRVPLENLPALRPHMATVIAASCAEDACVTYSYAEDVTEPGLIRVFEVWRDQAGVEAHFKSDHMAAWQAARAGAGLFDRKIFAYEVASERQL